MNYVLGKNYSTQNVGQGLMNIMPSNNNMCIMLPQFWRCSK